MPGDAAVDHLESSQFAARSFRFLTLQDIASEEVALLDLDDPAKVGLEGRGGLVDVVAVERHLRFEAKRVARAKSARFRSGIEQFAHDARTLVRRDVDLESI